MPARAGAQPAARDTPAATIALETGEQIWEAGCASCHGKDGKGQPDHLIGFEPPKSFPDFSDCSTSTPESDVQWRAVITHGGRARSFSPIMPAFEGILTGEQIDKVIDHVRSLCDEPAWPRGDLNLPRAMMTEKAFPENELVFSSWRITRSGTGVGRRRRIARCISINASAGSSSHRLRTSSRSFGCGSWVDAPAA